jgi:hypothetical protein
VLRKVVAWDQSVAVRAKARDLEGDASARRGWGWGSIVLLPWWE